MPGAGAIPTRLLLLTLLISGRELQAAGAATDADFSVGVEQALPVVGQPCQLWLTRDQAVAAPKPDGIAVTFRVVHGDNRANPIDLPATAGQRQDVIASVQWTPQQTGPVRISARVTVRDSDAGRLEVAPQKIFVTSRRLFFNYWQCPPEQRFVTSVMDNSDTTEAAIRWKRRGVRPLGWQGGQWHWVRGYGTPDKMAKLWSNMPAERVGIVIDEFGGGDKIDQQLGDALRLTRRLRPQMFLAPYCLSVSGRQMIAGYRVADLVLVETYTPDWRWDGFITGRWQTAVNAGLETKSIAVLGLGPQWIGTERELRRIFRMVRTTCPKMPGLGFFAAVPPRLRRAVDSAIEDYFLRPVVVARVEKGTFTVRNIGETPATDVEVTFLDQENQPVAPSKRVARLKPWMTSSGDLPPGASTARIAAATDRYTALSYISPLQRPKLDNNQQRASLQFREHVMAGAVTDALQQAAAMTVVRTDTSDADPNNHHNVRSASIPIPASQGQPIALAFDVRPNRCWFYGHNRVSLVGDGELTLTWARQDHDAGIAGNQPRPELVFKGPDDYVVREVPALGFRENETCHVVLAYDGGESVRAIVTGRNNQVLWDSGPLPAQGGFRCDQLRFDVNPFLRSEIRYDAAKSEIVLRGGGGGADSPYWLESTLSNLRLVRR
ncbi:MAG: hypothetical protein VX346_06345 [Planctomycetota bacterium]|nr:hypothetical protein [Planctomycetota bacterium]